MCIIDNTHKGNLRLNEVNQSLRTSSHFDLSENTDIALKHKIIVLRRQAYFCFISHIMYKALYSVSEYNIKLFFFNIE